MQCLQISLDNSLQKYASLRSNVSIEEYCIHTHSLSNYGGELLGDWLSLLAYCSYLGILLQGKNAPCLWSSCQLMPEHYKETIASFSLTKLAIAVQRPGTAGQQSIPALAERSNRESNVSSFWSSATFFSLQFKEIK